MHEIDEERVTNPNGVRVRMDGKGDPWALEHRSLGTRFLMQDVDGFSGAIAFSRNTADRLFQEYVPDSYVNRGNLIREFGLVALFDRKKTLNYALSASNVLATANYLWLCRVAATFQGIRPKFFFVAGEAAPWEIQELDIFTGETGRKESLQSDDFRRVWDLFGLVDIRRQLEKKLCS